MNNKAIIKIYHTLNFEIIRKNVLALPPLEARGSSDGGGFCRCACARVDPVRILSLKSEGDLYVCTRGGDGDGTRAHP